MLLTYYIFIFCLIIVLSLFLFYVNHTSAVVAFDLQIVARLGYAAAVRTLHGVRSDIVGTIVEWQNFGVLDCVVAKILLVYAHAHRVDNLVWLHRKVICDFGRISEPFALDCVDYARVFLLRRIAHPRNRRAVKSQHDEYDADCHNRRENRAAFFLASCADDGHCDAQRKHNCERDGQYELFGQILLKFAFFVFHNFIVLQTQYLVKKYAKDCLQIVWKESIKSKPRILR